MTDCAPRHKAVQHALRRRVPHVMPVWDELVRRLQERLGEATGDFGHVWLCDETVLEANPPALLDAPYDAILCPVWPCVAADVPGLMATLHGALRPGGLLLASVLGPGSFEEFRQAWAVAGGYPDDARHATGHVLPFADGPTWAGLLQQMKLESPVVDVDRITLTFSDFAPLYASLRAHGVANVHPARMAGLTGKGVFAAMEAAYRDMFGRADGKLPLTLEVLHVHGFKAGKTRVEIV